MNPSAQPLPQPLAAQGVWGLLSWVMWACTDRQKDPMGEFMYSHQRVIFLHV